MNGRADDVAAAVRRRIDACNRRETDDFVRRWADDARCFAFSDMPPAEGAAAVRARHVERFREPDLQGRPLSRVLVGDLVVGHETVTRNFPAERGEVEVVCRYDVSGDPIVRVWFRMGERRLDAAAAG